jgi:hypothetical protein
MTRNEMMSVWRRVLDASGDLGDALATPRGVSPDRAALQVSTRRENA